MEATAIRSLNPATGTPLGDLPVALADEVREAANRARLAQRSWAACKPAKRKRALRALRRVLAREAEAIARTISEETGKPSVEALVMELIPCLEMISHYASRAPRVLGRRRLALRLLRHRMSEVRHVPKGLVGIISPWNYPFSIAMGDAAMAMAAGNGVVIKPSELASRPMLLAKRLFDEAACESGMPSDLLQVVTGYVATAQAVIDTVDHVIFTGSVEVGRKVAAACAARLIGCTLELGGKAPAVVCADAELDRTARALVWGALANSGQTCAGVERVYAVEAIYDRLVDKVRAEVEALRQGDPADLATDLGAMTDPRQVERVEAQVADALIKGARLLTGGHPLAAPAQGYAATVLADTRPDMEVMGEETFGPVLPLMRVRDEEEAVAQANASELGLLAYVFTRDARKGRRLAEGIEAGTVMVNDVLATFGAPETPWGGMKHSGLGRVHGDEGLREVCETRHVNLPRWPWLSREPWWFPYGKGTLRLARTLIRLLYR